MAAAVSCPICLVDLEGSSARVATLCECRHVFHGGCVLRWLSEHETCPLCRSDVQSIILQRPAEDFDSDDDFFINSPLRPSSTSLSSRGEAEYELLDATPAAAEAPAPVADAPVPPASAFGGADPAAVLKQFQSAGDEFKALALVLQGSAQELVASYQASLLAQKDAAIAVLSNTADTSAPPAKVLYIFLWSSVLVLAASVSFSLFANLLHHFVGAFLGGFGAAFAALVAVPLYAYHYSLKGSSLADKDARFALLGYASLAGLFLGSAFAHLHIYAEPFAFLHPAISGIAYYYAAPAVGSSRVNLLAASLGGAFVALFAVGVLLGSGHELPASASYVAFATLYTLAGFAVLQYIYSHGAEPAHAYQLAYLTAFLYAKAVGVFLFGSHETFAAEEVVSKLGYPGSLPTPNS